MMKRTNYLAKQLLILFALSFFTFSFSWAQQDGALATTNSDYNEVGYRIIEYTRIDETDSEETRNKLIPVNLWHPISEETSEGLEKMTFSDYVKVIKKDKTYAENKALFARMLNSFGTIDSTNQEVLINEFLNASISVYHTSNDLENQYPLVIIGGAHPIYHADLAETIAQNGFVVASFPRLGMKAGERLPFSREGGEEYRKDLEFVISSLSQLEFIDKTQLAFIAWSFEGVPALEAACANSATKLFVSLDSSIGYQYGNDLLTDSTAIYEQEIIFPLFHYTSSSMDHGKDLGLLNELQTNSDKVEIDNTVELPHAKFTSMGSTTVNKVNKTAINLSYSSLILDVLDALINATTNKG